MHELQLSLLVPYRDRPQHLRSLLDWAAGNLPRGVEVVVAEASNIPTVDEVVRCIDNCKYTHVHCAGTFHLAKALNGALAKASASLVAPFDVDLIPAPGVLSRHIQLALDHPDVVFAGFRLLSKSTSIALDGIPEEFEIAELSMEDHSSALLKRIKTGERYGAVPILQAARLRQIQGWDEHYLGWGAEDQDMLERYLGTRGYLVRSEEFAYLHQEHGRVDAWYDKDLTNRNRARYYRFRRERLSGSEVIKNNA